MSEYKVQVKLEDGTLADFKSFAVDQGNGKVKEFNDIEDAEKFIQEIDQENIKSFMLRHFYDTLNPAYKQESQFFVDWYANLNVFDKAEFLRLLQKVHKIYE